MYQDYPEDEVFTKLECSIVDAARNLVNNKGQKGKPITYVDRETYLQLETLVSKYDQCLENIEEE